MSAYVLQKLAFKVLNALNSKQVSQTAPRLMDFSLVCLNLKVSATVGFDTADNANLINFINLLTFN